MYFNTRNTLILILVILLIVLLARRSYPAVMDATVTGYCLGPCKVCGTSGRTASGSRTSHGAAINPRAAVPALRRARRVRVLTSRGWSPWYRIDDTGRGPRNPRLRARWVDIRTANHGAMGQHRAKIEVQ